jgi:hypothetical protein
MIYFDRQPFIRPLWHRLICRAYKRPNVVSCSLVLSCLGACLNLVDGEVLMWETRDIVLPILVSWKMRRLNCKLFLMLQFTPHRTQSVQHIGPAHKRTQDFMLNVCIFVCFWRKSEHQIGKFSKIRTVRVRFFNAERLIGMMKPRNKVRRSLEINLTPLSPVGQRT